MCMCHERVCGNCQKAYTKPGDKDYETVTVGSGPSSVCYVCGDTNWRTHNLIGVAAANRMRFRANELADKQAMTAIN